VLAAPSSGVFPVESSVLISRSSFSLGFILPLEDFIFGAEAISFFCSLLPAFLCSVLPRRRFFFSFWQAAAKPKPLDSVAPWRHFLCIIHVSRSPRHGLVGRDIGGAKAPLPLTDPGPPCSLHFRAPGAACSLCLREVLVFAVRFLCSTHDPAVTVSRFDLCVSTSFFLRRVSRWASVSHSVIVLPT
jgi:hypothetical protein